MTNQTRQTNPNERGSALLVSLMVMVGLTLLGLGFVAISETESAISVNERNYAQTLAVAEAGARAVVEMFQDTDWAVALDILPPNNVALKTERTVGGYTGRYKPLGSAMLFDTPFKPSENDRFWGNEENADVIINAAAGNVAINYLRDLNITLLGANADARITEIRVYAPPIIGGTLNGGFWEGGERYGIATIKVTAQKTNASGNLVSRRSVKIVVGEAPLPGATGPIQTEGALASSGNFHVYWGKITSVEPLKVARPATGMPWFDAQEIINFEHGYDSTDVWKSHPANPTVYPAGARVHPPEAALIADPQLRDFAYETAAGGTVPAGTAAPATADWPKIIGNSFTHATVEWTAVRSTEYPLRPSDLYSRYFWLHEMLGKTIDDPWFHARSRSELTYDNAGLATPNFPAGHPYKYNTPAMDEEENFSNFFKNQTKTESPNFVEVTFPTIDYEFWKEIAQSAEPDSGIIYLRYSAGEFVSLDNVSQPMTWWLNAMENDYGPAFYFFDSANAQNPQYGGTGTLTPAVDINANTKGPDGTFQIQGFIYMNATTFGSSGQGTIVPVDVYPMPGEHFRDVGFREVDLDTDTFVVEAGAFKVIGRDNGAWDFQDVNENYFFDLVVKQRSVVIPSTGVAATFWLPVPYYEGCTDFVNDCSEPHEPYLNMIYPDLGDSDGALIFGWEDPDAQTHRPKTRTGENTFVDCSATPNPANCTTNGFDELGALVRLTPLLNGILYNEGGYSGSGNAWYYGALLMRGEINVTGTPKVYFNECILKGCWQEMLNLPRAIIYSIQTDQ
ncbi:MAG TPA: pilus assembly PilX N-terminal domain-containing protein [Thermoanaerobaculia bacterium]|nr:pilus assembly PilX N-terminal domain-containing protein [Thermoanaerobaculia bacterium]